MATEEEKKYAVDMLRAIVKSGEDADLTTWFDQASDDDVLERLWPLFRQIEIERAVRRPVENIRIFGA